jgi:tRNA G26 N,N-dimethylase Trm1
MSLDMHPKKFYIVLGIKISRFPNHMVRVFFKVINVMNKAKRSNENILIISHRNNPS